MPAAVHRPDAVVTPIRSVDAGGRGDPPLPPHLRLDQTGPDRWAIAVRGAGPRRPGRVLVLIDRRSAWYEVTSVSDGRWRAFATFAGSLADALETARAGAPDAAAVRGPRRLAGRVGNVTVLAMRRREILPDSPPDPHEHGPRLAPPASQATESTWR